MPPSPAGLTAPDALKTVLFLAAARVVPGCHRSGPQSVHSAAYGLQRDCLTWRTAHLAEPDSSLRVWQKTQPSVWPVRNVSPPLHCA